jgi:hypothetical protein
MSKLRKRLLEDVGEEEAKEFSLTDYEVQYLKDLNQILMFHTLRGNIISGFITYVCTTRLGYNQLPEDKALQYDLDSVVKGKDNKLKVKMIPKSDAPD